MLECDLDVVQTKLLMVAGREVGQQAQEECHFSKSWNKTQVVKHPEGMCLVQA